MTYSKIEKYIPLNKQDPTIILVITKSNSSLKNQSKNFTNNILHGVFLLKISAQSTTRDLTPILSKINSYIMFDWT